MTTKYNYAEVIVDGIHNRGNVVKLPDGMTNFDLDYYQKGEVIDGYHSVFMHSEDLLKHTTSTGSVRGYTGNTYCNYLFWDMDHDSIEQARVDSIELVERLISLTDQKNIRIYFSGGKGFHIFLRVNSLSEKREFNKYIKQICSNIATGLISFDAKIYDKTRVIRTPNSKHGKTGLYKVELTYLELCNFSIEQIKEYAKEQRPSQFTGDGIVSEELLDILLKTKEEVTADKTSSSNSSSLLDGVMYGFSSGGRNSGMASIAGLLHSRNFDNDFVKAVLININSNNEPPLSEREINNIVESVSKYPVSAEYADPDTTDIATIKDAADDWYRIIKSSGYTSFGERFPHINQRMKICIPGDVVAIVANSGVGKSTIGLEFGNNEAKSRDLYSLMASLEMSRAGLFFRVATIESLKHVNNHVPSEQVVKDLLEEQELRDRVVNEWKHLLVVDRGSLSLEKITEYFKLAQERYSGKISNLIIDYAQNIQGAEEIEYAMRMARQLKTIAKELNTKVFVLMQCNKTMPNDYTQVQKNHIEGAGAYFQACDYIMGFWRSRDMNNRLHGCFIKDRWGSADFMFDLVREGLKYHSEDYLEDKTVNDLYAL